MTTVTTPIHTQFRTIDGFSIRFAESAPHEQQALLLCPWPEFWAMGPGHDLVRLYPLSRQNHLTIQRGCLTFGTDHRTRAASAPLPPAHRAISRTRR
jgi:hypothetical protein